jgi:malate dehydrogenase
VSQFLSEEALEKVAADTMVWCNSYGALGTSAWYAPGASVAYLVDSILNDQKKMIACSVFVEGEYEQNDICIGVPCIIGKNGVEEIIEIELNDKEKATFAKSAEAVRNERCAEINFSLIIIYITKTALCSLLILINK